MKSLVQEIKTSLLLTVVFALLLCGAYPVAVWAGGQLLFRDKADGSLVTDADGTVRGSTLLAQSFTGEAYFHPRPSAAGAGYDAASSSGTNLGPTSKRLAEGVQAAAAAYRIENGLPSHSTVPADAVTSSGSGLDPHISVANAQIQSDRVARARNLPASQVRQLIASHTEDRDLRIFGEPRINVLMLNRALGALAPIATR